MAVDDGLAARMEQIARPGTIQIWAGTLRRRI
jgi:hypothetical protein